MTLSISTLDELKAQALKSLCYYDPRNPFYVDLDLDEDEREKLPDVCYCDNCFHGLNKLALTILELLDEL